MQKALTFSSKTTNMFVGLEQSFLSYKQKMILKNNKNIIIVGY